MKYHENADDTCNELKHFQDFLYRHFYKHEHYEEMRPRSNQSGRFLATAKTHKFKYAPLLTKLVLISRKLRKL